MFQQILLQIILILVNAFFAATEIAVISLNEKKLKVRAEDGDKKAVKMLKMIEEPTRFLSTIQIGITLAGFLGSAFAADNFSERLTGFVVKAFSVPSEQIELVDSVSVIVITLVLSFFTLVLGELVPKRVAMKHKDKLAEAVCGTVSGLAFILKPVIWFLTVSTNLVIRIFGVDPNEKDEAVSEEDIVLMLDAGADEGSIDKDNIEYIKNVFKFDGMTAGDVMTPRSSVMFLSKDASRDEIISKINEGYSRIPVYSENTDAVIGILHAREYLLKAANGEVALADALLQPIFVPETAHLDLLFKDMQKRHTHMVVVINEYGETAGVLTMEDILEQIVGDIWDEADEATESIKLIGKDNYKVLCSVNIDEFFNAFGIEGEQTDAATVNGWLSEKLGMIPEKGQTLNFENLEIAVTDADETMSREITVKVLEKEVNMEEKR